MCSCLCTYICPVFLRICMQLVFNFALYSDNVNKMTRQQFICLFISIYFFVILCREKIVWLPYLYLLPMLLMFVTLCVCQVVEDRLLHPAPRGPAGHEGVSCGAATKQIPRYLTTKDRQVDLSCHSVCHCLQWFLLLRYCRIYCKHLPNKTALSDFFNLDSIDGINLTPLHILS